MAGSSNIGEEQDNPVHINVVPLVDIILCLCIFFFCSFHFRPLEGKMESWLPKDKGVNTTPVKNVMVEEGTVFSASNVAAVHRIAGVQPSSGRLRPCLDRLIRLKYFETITTTGGAFR